MKQDNTIHTIDTIDRVLGRINLWVWSIPLSIAVNDAKVRTEERMFQFHVREGMGWTVSARTLFPDKHYEEDDSEE